MIKALIFRERSNLVASPTEIKEFETEFGLRLPPAYIEFCSKYNGGFPALSNRFYRVPDEFLEFHEEYGPTNEGPVGIIVDVLLGLTRSLEACDLRPELLSMRTMSKIGIFPITLDLLGNSAVLREDSMSGRVYWRDHELWEAPDVPALFPIAESLELFYNQLVQDPFLTEDDEGT